MLLAIAALLFQFSPATLTSSQADAALDADSSTPAPALYAANLPDASSPVVTFVPTTSPQPSGAAAAPENHPASPSAASLQASLQNSQSLSLLRVPEPEAARFVSPELTPSRKTWIALSVLQHAAASFDAYSTRDAISRGAVEQDPLMRPFANSSAIYAAIQVAPVALDFAARRMQRSPNNFLRRTWWLPQSLSAGMFVISGVHNIHVANAQ